MIECKSHKTYKAVHPPRTPCARCWKKFMRQHTTRREHVRVYELLCGLWHMTRSGLQIDEVGYDGDISLSVRLENKKVPVFEPNVFIPSLGNPFRGDDWPTWLQTYRRWIDEVFG